MAPLRWTLPVLVLLGACASPAASVAPSPAGAAYVVVGNRYDKSSYVTGGKTVVSFRLEVSNRGDAEGRAEDPACHTTVRGRKLPLEIFENPELEPGERGWLRTGGAIPELGPRDFDDLEAYCDLAT